MKTSKSLENFQHPIHNNKDFYLNNPKISKKIMGEIFNAIDNYDIDNLKELLNNITDINIINEALRNAVELSDFDIIKYLVEEKGANLNYYNNYALIITAAFDNFVDLLKYYENKGIDIHYRNDLALRLSANNGNTNILKYLIKRGANIHTYDEYALRHSAQEGYLDIVKILIKNGADIHAKNDYALISSAKNGHYKIVKYLIENGANIHANNDLALYYSIKKDYQKITDYLIKNGANKNDAIKNKNNNIKTYSNKGFLMPYNLRKSIK